MGAWVWAGFLAFFVVSLVVGVRLLLLWRRTRQLPELLVGTAVLGIGPIGFGAMVVAGALVDAGTSSGSALVRGSFAVGTATVAIGIVAQCVFSWQVYRPASRWARAVTVAFALALVGLFVHAGVSRGFAPTRVVGPETLAQSALQVAALLWGSIEALRYAGLLRRRAQFGLSDPVVTNRFLLWSFAAAAAGIGTAIGSVAGWWTGAATLEIPWVVASSSAHGMAAAIAMGLAFVPPRAYTRWIRARAAARSERAAGNAVPRVDIPTDREG